MSDRKGFVGKIVGSLMVPLIGFIIIMGSWYTVDQGRLGVVLRNGELIKVAEPGLGFKIPLIDRVVEMSTRTQKATYTNIESYSKDIQAANVNVAVNYRLTPAMVGEIYEKLGVHYVSRVITPAVLAQTKIVFGQFNAVRIVSERELLTQQVTEAVRAKVQESGIIIESVQLENISFSRAYENSIEDRMKAEVEVERYTQNLEREKIEAEIVRTKAQGQADARVAAAKAEAEAIELKGKAEASAIHAKGEALRKNPELVSLIQAEKWNGVLPSTMVPNGTVPFLNVDKK